jgi:hypothetical protein
VVIETPAPELPSEMTTAPVVETDLPEPLTQHPNEATETAVKPMDAEPGIKEKEAAPAEPAPAGPDRRAVRTLSPRLAVPIRPGRILRPRR